jgi:hypothetical protein
LLIIEELNVFKAIKKSQYACSIILLSITASVVAQPIIGPTPEAGEPSRYSATPPITPAPQPVIPSITTQPTEVERPTSIPASTIRSIPVYAEGREIGTIEHRQLPALIGWLRGR